MAKALGKPVKLTWQREQDLTHDQYRPMALERVRAGLGAGNSVSDFWARNMSPSISAQRGRLPAGAVDSSAVEGLTASPYASTSTLREWCQLGACAPVSYWRSVGHSINAFAAECAIDELAVAAGADPYQFRRRLMTSSRHLAVLDAAASLAGWNSPPPTGRARGIAFSEPFGSLCEQVVEVSQPTAGKIKVHKVACAIDCGLAVNPAIVVAQ